MLGWLSCFREVGCLCISVTILSLCPSFLSGNDPEGKDDNHRPGEVQFQWNVRILQKQNGSQEKYEQRGKAGNSQAKSQLPPCKAMVVFRRVRMQEWSLGKQQNPSNHQGELDQGGDCQPAIYWYLEVLLISKPAANVAGNHFQHHYLSQFLVSLLSGTTFKAPPWLYFNPNQ